MMHRYAAAIEWSDEDAAFIAVAPDLPSCMTHGGTHEDALSEIQTAIALWLDTAAEFGDAISPPRADWLPHEDSNRRLNLCSRRLSVDDHEARSW